MKVTLFMPVLDEEEGLRLILPKIQAGWFDQILVADGGSKDRSVNIAQSFGCEVIIQKNPGLRQAYLEAWPKIRNAYVVTFSPDGNCMPEALPELLAKLEEGHDMVIVSRYLGKAKSEDDDPLTAFGNRLFTFLINFLFHARYTDVMNIFRGYRKDLLQELKIEEGAAPAVEKILHTRGGIEPLLSARAAKHKMKIAEIPADEPKRVGGKRKLQIVRWGLLYLYQILRDFIC